MVKKHNMKGTKTSRILCPYLLTYSRVQSPSWAANWFTASQEIPRISRKPKVHYRTHKRTPPVPILGQPNPVHMPTSHLLEIHRNIIHLSTPRSPQWSLSLRFPHQVPIHPPLLTHTRHMPSPSHSSWFYHPHDIVWGVQIARYWVRSTNLCPCIPEFGTRCRSMVCFTFQSPYTKGRSVCFPLHRNPDGIQNRASWFGQKKIPTACW